MQCQLIGGHGMFCYGVEKQRLEQGRTFGVFDPPACDAAAIDVESDIPPTFRPATAETPLVRRLLIGIAVAGLALLVFAPAFGGVCRGAGTGLDRSGAKPGQPRRVVSHQVDASYRWYLDSDERGLWDCCRMVHHKV